MTDITLNTVRATIRNCKGLSSATRAVLTSPVCTWSTAEGTIFNTKMPADEDGIISNVQVERLGNSETVLIRICDETGAGAGVHATICHH